MTEVAVDEVAAPQSITQDEFEGCQSAILSNVEQGYADPLLGLSTETEEQLLRLAYSDIVGLERMERAIKAAIRDRNDGEGAAKAFSLSTYKRGANQLAKKLNEERTRKAKLRERNLRLIQGGKDAGGTDVPVPDDTAISVQAMVEATSVFLRAGGLLRMFRQGRIWKDSFYGDYFSDWDGTANDTVIAARKIDDAFLLNVHRWLLMLDTKLGQVGTTTTEKVVYDFANQDVRSAPKEWLTSLKWDQVERLPTLLSTAYGTPQDVYHAAVGRCWWTAMAARVFAPGCKMDNMIVLYGPQGTYKSTSLSIIGGPYYRIINVDAQSKDFFDALRGVLVAEIAELDAFSSSKVENSRIKTLLSTAVDSYRKSYGRVTEDYPRTAVLHGTTNDSAFHSDSTGGRRYWPVNCYGLIDTEWLKTNRDQLFAEAVVRYQRGESWSDVPRDVQEAMIAEHYSEDPWSPRIDAAIASWRVHTGPRSDVAPVMGDPTSNLEETHWGTLLTTERVMTLALGIAVDRQDLRTSRRVANTMRRLGWKYTAVRARGAAKAVRAWVRGEGNDGEGERLSSW